MTLPLATHAEMRANMALLGLSPFQALPQQPRSAVSAHPQCSNSLSAWALDLPGWKALNPKRVPSNPVVPEFHSVRLRQDLAGARRDGGLTVMVSAGGGGGCAWRIPAGDAAARSHGRRRHLRLPLRLRALAHVRSSSCELVAAAWSPDRRGGCRDFTSPGIFGKRGLMDVEALDGSCSTNEFAAVTVDDIAARPQTVAQSLLRSCLASSPLTGAPWKRARRLG